jgi:hypothetical protein
MRPGKRFGFSAVEKSKIWSRWKAGQSLHEIGRAFDKPHSSIRCLLLPRGGIPPAARHRSRLALTFAEREDISRGIASGSTIREIARRLDRAASTLSREISRIGGRPAYRAHAADDHAWDSALRPKKCLLAVSRKLRNIVASKLILDWSPEQISGWLKIQFPDDASMRVSHETIYNSLFIQAREINPRANSANRPVRLFGATKIFILPRNAEVVSNVAESEGKKILAGFQRADRGDLNRVAALPRDPEVDQSFLIKSDPRVSCERAHLADSDLAMIGLLIHPDDIDLVVLNSLIGPQLIDERRRDVSVDRRRTPTKFPNDRRANSRNKNAFRYSLCSHPAPLRVLHLRQYSIFIHV